jgi:hypothetical protein
MSSILVVLRSIPFTSHPLISCCNRRCILSPPQRGVLRSRTLCRLRHLSGGEGQGTHDMMGGEILVAYLLLPWSDAFRLSEEEPRPRGRPNSALWRTKLGRSPCLPRPCAAMLRRTGSRLHHQQRHPPEPLHAPSSGRSGKSTTSRTPLWRLRKQQHRSRPPPWSSVRPQLILTPTPILPAIAPPRA